MTDDPHLLNKIASCLSVQELDGLVAGLRRQRIEPPSDVTQAIARPSAELEKGRA